MPLYEPLVPTRYTVPLLEHLRGVYPQLVERVLAEIGVDPAMIEDASAVLGIGQFDALLVAMSRLTGRGDLGFELGRRITIGMHGALGQAMQRCSTMDEMLRLASRYARLMSPSFMLQYLRQPAQGELIWRPAAGMSTDTLHMFYEIHVVSLYMLMQEALGGRMQGYEVWMPMPAPEHAALYRELRQLRVHFGASPIPQVRTLIGGELLDQALPKPAAESGVAGSAELSRLQRGAARATRWSEWVRMMLREADSHQPSQVELAELLNLSAHTLARYLAREDCSFRLLASEVRHQRACALLADPRMSIGEIAHRLGYGDATNFSHAFHRIAGESARAYRQRAGGGMRGGVGRIDEPPSATGGFRSRHPPQRSRRSGAPRPERGGSAPGFRALKVPNGHSEQNHAQF